MKIICLLLLLLACDQVLTAQSLEALRVDITPFLKKGCKKSTHSPGSLDCTVLALKEKFHIWSVYEVPNSLGGLRPALPMIQGFVTYNRQDESKNKGVRRTGCRLPAFVQYVVYSKNEFRVIDTQESFLSHFAPVDSAAEALSFAVALTGSYPIHKIEIEKGMVVASAKTRPTFVRKVSGGYVVNLFGGNSCGCGPHWTYSIEYMVTKDGTVYEISRQEFYRDPDKDDLCVD